MEQTDAQPTPITHLYFALQFRL